MDFVDRGDGVRLVRLPQDQAERLAAWRSHFSKTSGAADYNGMDGKTFVDWLRGERDDDDVG